MTSQNELPPLPRWNVGKVADDARSLFGSVLKPWSGETMTKQSVSMIVDDIADFFEFKRQEHYVALLQTLCLDLDVELEPKVLRRIAMQLVTNFKTLKEGKSLTAFEGVRRSEWVPFGIMAVEPTTFGTRHGAVLRLVVLAGPYAGFDAEKKAPLAFLPRLAYDVGFNRKLTYDDPKELTDMQFAGYLSQSSEPELCFEEYRVTSSMKKQNQTLLRKRKTENE